MLDVKLKMDMVQNMTLSIADNENNRKLLNEARCWLGNLINWEQGNAFTILVSIKMVDINRVKAFLFFLTD